MRAGLQCGYIAGMKSLRKWMKHTGTTQVQLAAVLEVTQPTVSDWLRRRKAPKSERLGRLSAITGIPVETLRKEAA